MQANKIGITNQNKIKEIEYFLFNVKYHIIDESYTFNEEDAFNTKYLEKLHQFLFSDIYEEEDCKIREEIEPEVLDELNKELKELKVLFYYDDVEQIKEKIYKLWETQIFHDGNTRTILCFLKIISNIYDFNITYDFTKDIDKDYFINEVIDSIQSKKEKKI